MAVDPRMKQFFSKGVKDYAHMRLPVACADIAIQRLPPFTSSSIVLDNACGPATVTGRIIAKCEADGARPPEIFAIDNSEGMIENAKERIQKENWQTVTAEVMDGKNLSGFQDNYFTHSITGLAINMTGTKEMYRTLQKGGTAVTTLWKVQALVDLANQVRDRLNPDLAPFPQGFLAEWWTEDFLIRTMKEGFNDFETEVAKFSQTYDSIDKVLEEFRTPFYMIARSDLSDEEKAKFEGVLEDIMRERSLTFDFEIWCGTAVKK